MYKISDYFWSLFIELICQMSIVQQQLSMRAKALQRQKNNETPAIKRKAPALSDNEKSQTIETYYEQPSLRTKTYSFQDLPHESLNEFCSQVHQIHALLHIGKRITDPNVLMLNSTQKEMVEMIIDNNKHSLGQKSKFLTQRAGKYIKLLWKSQKFNDSLIQCPVKVEKAQPHYASPIHNFKKPKVATNASLSPLSHQEDRSISKNRLQKVDQASKYNTNQTTSRSKRVHSEDQKFSNVRIGKYEKKQKGKDKQKSFEVDLSKNIAWRTMNTTKNFDNMLKILKKQQ